jgi:hypothetical protein
MFAQGLGVNEEHEVGRLTVIDMVNALALRLRLRHPRPHLLHLVLFEIDIHIVLDIYLRSEVLREFMIKEGET